MIILEPKWKSWIVETTTPLFTPEQCQMVIDAGRKQRPQKAQVGMGKPGGGVDTKKRTTTISWIPFKEKQPMYDQINEFIKNFNNIKSFVKKITLEAIKKGIPKGVVLNVNFPKLKESEIKGIKICRQAKTYWIEEFDKRINPQGQKYYWLTGKFINEDNGKDTDEYALDKGYISIVPTQFDFTAYKAINEIKKLTL